MIKLCLKLIKRCLLLVWLMSLLGIPKQSTIAAPQCSKIEFGSVVTINRENFTTYYEVSPEYGFVNQTVPRDEIVTSTFRILFEDSTLYVYNSDHQLTRVFTNVSNYLVSPNNHHILFFQRTTTDEKTVYLITDNYHITQLYRSNDYFSVRWGIDEQTIYMTQDNNLFHYNFNDKRFDQLNNEPVSNGLRSISPDGKHLILVDIIFTWGSDSDYRTNMMSFNTKTNQSQLIVPFIEKDPLGVKYHELSRQDGFLMWLSNTQFLLWTNRHVPFNKYQFYSVDVETNEFSLFGPYQFEINNLGFYVSPDNSKLAFKQQRLEREHLPTRDKNTKSTYQEAYKLVHDIFILDIVNQSVYQLTTQYNLEIGGQSLDWSPDGRRIAFSGRWMNQENNEHYAPHDVFIIDVENTTLQQVTHTPDIHEYVLDWQPCSQR